jgi:hypothetical protein
VRGLVRPPNSVLRTFHSFDDGVHYAELVQDTNGNFYGTTTEGGAAGRAADTWGKARCYDLGLDGSSGARRRADLYSGPGRAFKL